MLSRETTFTLTDIKDRQLLESEIEKEARRIYNSPAANRGRSLDQIKNSVRQGKTAELWLYENEGFSLAEDIYHDLIDEQGDYAEVKAFSVYSSDAPYVQDALKRIKNGTWNKSKYMILFNYDKGVYTFLEKIQIR